MVAVLAVALLAAAVVRVERVTDTYTVIAAALAVVVAMLSAVNSAAARREAADVGTDANRIRSEMLDVQRRLTGIEEERLERERQEAADR